jgi:hypothetical protein
VEINSYQPCAPQVQTSCVAVIGFQVEELLKTRERIHESFTCIPAIAKKVSSSNNNGKGVGEEFTVSADESESSTHEESSADKANKSKKWFSLNFKTNVTSAGK